LTLDLTRPAITMLPAITLWRPWPAIIFLLGKNVENRNWALKHRGDLFISAGRQWDPAALPFAREVAGEAADQIVDDPAAHPLGIVGVVHVTGVCSWDDHAFACSPWAANAKKHWQLRNSKAFPTPVPHLGKQALWRPDDSAQPMLAEQLQAVGRAV